MTVSWQDSSIIPDFFSVGINSSAGLSKGLHPRNLGLVEIYPLRYFLLIALWGEKVVRKFPLLGPWIYY